jgi:GWxTD domain-containing protein
MLLWLGAAGVATAAEPLGPMPWRVGGRVGFTVDAASFPDSTGYTLEVYIRIPPATIDQLTRDAGGKGRLRLGLKLRDPAGAQRQFTQELPISAAESSDGFGKVVLVRFPTRPGSQKLQVRLEDMHSRKRGLAYIGRKVREGETIEDEFFAPNPQAGRDLSSIEFAWSADSVTRIDSFVRAGLRILPNPERLYGLFSKELQAIFTARSRPGDERPWHWSARLLDGTGQVVAAAESTAAANRWLNGAVTLDVSRQPAGGYDLEIKAWQEGDSATILRKARCSVAWERDAWLRNPRDVVDDVHFILSAGDEEAFERMHPGEQERYLQEFWRRRDPDPSTPQNEARDEYHRRVETARRTFGSSDLMAGPFSDQGRVFIRYGEPNEILNQVIPTGDNTLAQVIRELARIEDRPMGDVYQKGPGGDMRPFEVWIYEGEIPVPPDADPQVERRFHKRRLVFLFVDERGTGDFRLRYSNE